MRGALCKVHAWLAAIWILLSCLAPAATAHSALISVVPPDGALLKEAPTQVVLTFNEPVQPLAVTLAGSDGSRRDLLDASRGGINLVVNLPDDLSRGTFLVSWRAVSGDGHAIAGAASFSVGVASGGMPSGAVQGDTKVSVALWVAKLALYVGLFFGVGIAAFAALVAPVPPPVGRLAVAAMLLGFAAAPISLVLDGMDALGLGFERALDANAWAAGFSTPFSLTVAACLAALMLAGFSLALGGAISKVLAIAGLLVVSVSLTLSGHAAAAEPQWITRPALCLHVLGIVFWIGSLPPLLALLGSSPCELAAPLARFSTVAPYPVAAILVSGTVLAVIQLGPQPIFWLSVYGAILSCKLILVAVLLGLAAWNRFGLTRPVLAGNVRAITLLRRSMRLEVALFLAVLALVAGWRFAPPPRAMAEAPHARVELRLHGDALTAEVSLAPGRIGVNSISVVLMDGRRDLVVPQEMTAIISSPELGIGPMRRPLAPSGAGFWQGSDIAVPLAGPWLVELEVRPSRFELVRLSGSFNIP